MKRDVIRVRRVLVVMVLVLAAGCSQPLLMLPGGALEGRVVPLPADWSTLAAIKTIQIETQPDDPYSVHLWIVTIDDVPYIHAGANRATWVEHLEVDPRLRLRVGEELYELAGARVSAADEFARFADAYEAKYDRRPRNENVAEAYLYRLSARE